MPSFSRSESARRAYAAARGEAASPSAFVWAAAMVAHARGGDYDVAIGRAVRAIVDAPSPLDAAREVLGEFLAGIRLDPADLISDADAVRGLEVSGLDDSERHREDDPGAPATAPVPGDYGDDDRAQNLADVGLRPDRADDVRSLSEIKIAATVLLAAIGRRAALGPLALEARAVVRSLAFGTLKKSRTAALALDAIATAFGEAALAAGTAMPERTPEDRELVDDLVARGEDSATVNRALALSADYELAKRSGYRGSRASFIAHGIEHFRKNPS